MKIKIFSLILGLSLALFSCTSNSKPKTAIITGKATINWSNSLTFHDGPVPLTDSWVNRINIGDSIIKLNDDGTFKIELSIDKPNFYTLAHESNKEELFVSPNDSIHIDFDADTLHSGRGALHNNHLRKMRVMINNNRRYINGLEFFNKSTDYVDSILDSLKTVYLNTHQEFKNNNDVSEIIDSRILADIDYRSKLYKVVHPPIYTQQTNETLPVAKTYYDNLGEGSLNNPELLSSLDYALFLDAYVTAQTAGEYRFGNYFDAPIEEIHPRYETIQKLEAHQDIKDYLLHQHLNKSMDNYGVAYLDDLIPQFKEDCKNEDYVKEIESRYEKGVERRKEPSEIKIYKQIGDIELEAHIFYPEDYKESDKRPAYVFFHGGGWETGIPEWGYANSKRYSQKGMVAISFEYRIINIHKSNILDCIRDVKSAILWTRKHASSLGIDPNKIVAAGFSAGGHLAACTAILDEFEEEDNSGLSSKPNAIVVHSASYNTTKNEWFARNSEQKPEAISTFHQVDKGLVPSIFFHGTDDHLAPISEFTEFRDKMDELGNDYEYKIFENVGHFFGNPEARKTVHEMTEAFFVKLGYIEK
jgi:acetyl esterase/lipase